MSLKQDVDRSHIMVTDWLTKNYDNLATRATYYDALLLWARCFYGKDSVANYRDPASPWYHMKTNKLTRICEIERWVEKYFSESDERNFTDDFKTFIQWLKSEGYANLSVRKNCSKVKVFFDMNDPRCKISENDWKQIKGNLLPRSKRAATQDEILTKDQIRTILKYMGIHAKAVVLFMLCTGARLGAVCQIKMSDIHLEADLPWVNIREEYTKREIGGRIMWITYEARDAIKDWLKLRDFTKKRGTSGDFDRTLAFNFTENTFRNAWNKALRRADGKGRPAVLARRDTSTKIRMHVYHVHTFRKFFRTEMGMAGVQDMVVHAWMGHQAYLNVYDKLGKRRLEEIYKEHMDVVTIYEEGLDEKARSKYQDMVAKSEKAENQRRDDNAFLNVLGGQLDIFGDMSEIEREAMTLDEKKQRIISKVVKLKLDKDNR